MESAPTIVKPGVSLRNVVAITAISAGYLLISALLIGFKTDQVVLVLLFNGLYYLSAGTRRFILGFSIFILFWVLFDLMKAFPNYRYNTVHIESLYRTEKNLFGIEGSGGSTAIPGDVAGSVISANAADSRETPNEYWAAHSSATLDILAGLFYLCWIPLPLGFAAWLFYRDREMFFRFSLTFLLVNLLGFIVYYIYPAAPPWYVQQYGFDFQPHTPGNTAGLGRFDRLFHVSVFSGLYAKSSNVFAAMPSLHASYPLLVFYYGLRKKLFPASIFFGIVMAGIWFAAVYSGHHYVLDVLAGIVCGISGILLFNYLYRNSGWVARMVGGFVAKTAP
jgi:membrane-associated phospholipid phosphatase